MPRITAPPAGGQRFTAPPPGRQLTQPELQQALSQPAAYMPRGRMADIFYDRRPIVGLSGPAGTGKSRMLLEKIHLLMEKYPGARALIARKTRESLSEAALFTFEEKVLPPGHPAREGPRRSHRQKYIYPNGSEIMVVGLDKPQKIMSTEYDVAYVQEAIECSDGDIQDITTRLRNGVIPYQQLLFDTNPDKPLHWIKAGSDKGLFPLHNTHHEDNPRLWQEAPPEQQARARQRPQGLRTEYEWPEESPDGRIGRWTNEGKAYIATLERLTGPRYDRLRKGLWVQAEGVVYTKWDYDRNMVNMPSVLPARRIWTVDFGYTHPLVMQRWAVDGDARMTMYAELYKTRTLIKDAARDFLASAGWVWDPDAGDHLPHPDYVAAGAEPEPLPEAVVCDWDAEGRATFEEVTGLRTEPAYKTISDGIQNMEVRLGLGADGVPRMVFVRDALIHEPDPELGEVIAPQMTVQEFDGYVWDVNNGRKKGEVPVDKDNHGMDASRYAAAYVDSIKDKVVAADVAEGALANTPSVVGVPSNGRRDDPRGSQERGKVGTGTLQVRVGEPSDGFWRGARQRQLARRGQR